MPKSCLKEYTTTESDKKKGRSRLPSEIFLIEHNPEIPKSVFLSPKSEGIPEAKKSSNDDVVNFKLLNDISEPAESIYQANNKSTQAKLTDFKPIRIIGKGGFGVVYLVEKKTDSQLYAMKQIKKELIIKKNMITSIKFEKDILNIVHHPFLVGMEYCFQTKINIYFVMKYFKGGELYKHLLRQKRFSENNAKLYGAQILLGLGELHKNNIIYRDMKPENILLGADGYVALTDFGLSKIIEDGAPTGTFCGTSEYVAPELIQGDKYTDTVDWWGLGILLHEMIIGAPPFRNKNKFSLYKEIKTREVNFSKYDVPISKEAANIIKLLLIKNPNKRLGAQGVIEIIKHPFFKTIDFDKLLKKELPVE